MRGLCLVLCTGALGLLFAGCTIWQQKSVLDQGVGSGRFRPVHHVSAAEAANGARASLGGWRGEIRMRARLYPRLRYANLPAGVVHDRLRALARRYGFSIDQVSFIRVFRGQVAPRIVVQTTHYLRLARATPLILERINPYRRHVPRGRTHARFEAFYFQANDEHGVPFLGAYSFVRGKDPGGGQWARSEALFPFAHG